MTEGLMGVWEEVKEQLSDLKALILDPIIGFVTEKIVVGGVTWILSLLNPASAFIKACKAIYDIIMFFVERGSQIMSLVNAVLDSLGSIAGGAVGVAANFIESALGKSVPVVLGFLSSLLGVSGISTKIRSLIEAVRAPIGKAIDWVIDKAFQVAKAAGKLLGFGKQEDGKGTGAEKHLQRSR